MFVSKHHLPNLLPPSAYFSPVHYAKEIEHCFQRAWHCVATTDELVRDGSYFTCDLLGHPLILWNRSGTIHCFLNICSHRYCTLTDKKVGCFHDRLKCQYHGWEFDDTGNTRKIPDAASFKPLKPGLLGLTKYRCEVVGKLVWVNLSHESPDLETYLRPELYQLVSKWFDQDSRLVITERDFANHADHACNWKVIIENVLESYHVQMVHPATFKQWSPEHQCTHRFHDQWDQLQVDYSDEGNRMQAIVSRLIGVQPDYTWHHICRYPNVVFGQLAWFHFVQASVPLGPERTRFFTRVVVNPGKAGTWRAAWMYQWLRMWAKRWFPAVNREDASVYSGVQKGLMSPTLPAGGLVSRREERIFPFQRYIVAQTGIQPLQATDVVLGSAQ